MPASKPQDRFSHVAREHLLVLDDRLRVKAASKSFYAALQASPGKMAGKKLADLGAGEWNIPALLAMLDDLPKTDGEFSHLEFEQDHPVLKRRTLAVNARWL